MSTRNDGMRLSTAWEIWPTGLQFKLQSAENYDWITEVAIRAMLFWGKVPCYSIKYVSSR